MRKRTIRIRRVAVGDENSLAYVQTESWKAAFKEIIPADVLLKHTDIKRTVEMYRKLLSDNKGYGYILELDENPHCIAWWDSTREQGMEGFAELICIHSLKDNWHKGYGNLMMEQILSDVKASGYSDLMLWVFADNIPAIKFYESNGFTASGKKKLAFGAMEEMYVKKI